MVTWTIPAGLGVSVARADDPGRQWRPHTMTRTLELTEYRTAEVFGGSGAIVFRSGDWLILTRRERISA